MKSVPLNRRVVTPSWSGRPLIDLSWQDHAACRDGNCAAFFPARGNAKAAEARTACEGCPVRPACREYAIGHEETDGIWGGLGPKQLRKIRAARNRAVKAARRAARDLALARHANPARTTSGAPRALAAGKTTGKTSRKPPADHPTNHRTAPVTLDSATPRRRTTP